LNLRSKLNSSIWVIVPAAGVGARMQADCPKQYLKLSHSTLIEVTLTRLFRLSSFLGFTRIYVGLSESDKQWPTLDIAMNPKITTYLGGNERVDTVLRGLFAIESMAKPGDRVLIHDAARPCFRISDIIGLVKMTESHDVGGILAVPIHDTLKKIKPVQKNDSSLYVENTVDRTQYWRAQTPQIFRFGLLKDALQTALEKGWQITDESSAIEACGYDYQIIEGHLDNIKITRPGDLALADFYLGGLALNNEMIT